jgi:hypothetical protein
LFRVRDQWRSESEKVQRQTCPVDKGQQFDNGTDTPLKHRPIKPNDAH